MIIHCCDRGSIGHTCTKSLAILNLVELEGCVRGIIAVKDLLGLDTKRSGTEREHDDRGVRDQAFQLCLCGCLIVIARLQLGKA